MNSVQTVCMGFTVRCSLKYWVVQDVDVKGHDRRSIIGSKLWQLHKELWGNREKQTENKFRRHLDVFTLMCRTYRLTSCVLNHSRRYCCATSSKLSWVMFVNVHHSNFNRKVVRLRLDYYNKSIHRKCSPWLYVRNQTIF